MILKIRWYFIAILLCSISISCSKKIVPLAGYGTIKREMRAVDVNKITFISKENISLNVDYEFKLNLSDSILVYKDTIYSNYKTFSFKINRGKTYAISVFSLCDCWGFKKYMFNPEAIVSNDFGEKLDLKQTSVKFGYDKGPLSLDKKWTLTSKTDGNIYLSVFSNNESLQKDLYNFIATGVAYSGTVFIPLVIPVSVKSSLIGEFVIRVDEL